MISAADRWTLSPLLAAMLDATRAAAIHHWRVTDAFMAWDSRFGGGEVRTTRLKVDGRLVTVNAELLLAEQMGPDDRFLASLAGSMSLHKVMVPEGQYGDRGAVVVASVLWLVSPVLRFAVSPVAARR